MMSQKSPNAVDRHIGARIRLLRTLAGLSQERLGEMLGVSFQQVQKYEKGTNRIGSGRLQEIANALDVPVSSFFEGQSGLTTSTEEATAIQAFLSSRDGTDLAKAFTRIESPAVRRALLDLANAIAKT